MSLRALKSFAVVLSLVACANEMQEIGAPDDNSGGSGSGASGGEASSGGSGSGASGGSGGSGSTGGTSSTGSGGKGGATGAFGGSAGVTGSGGSTGGNGGSAGGAGGAGGSSGSTSGAGGASGSGGSGGTGEPGTEDCSGATPWVASQGLTTPIPAGGEVSYMNKLLTYAGETPLSDFNSACPPEGSRAAWCESSTYVYELVGVCL